MSDYVSRVSADLQQRYAGQPEYLQAVLTWLEMIAPALKDEPAYERLDLLTRMVEPEKVAVTERLGQPMKAVPSSRKPTA